MQTHHKQPPVAVWSDDLMSHAGGTVTSSPNLTEGWFPVYPLLQPPFFFIVTDGGAKSALVRSAFQST